MKDIVKADSLIPFLNEKNKTDLKYNKDSIIERKEVFINKVETANEEDGTILCTITTQDVDRAGDIVLASGCDATQFKKIPSVYVNHDYAQLPIASCEELIYQNDSIMAKVKFALTVPEIKNIWERVKAGVMKGVSIGFAANEVILRGTKAFDDIVKTFNLNAKELQKLTRIITKWELYEFSLCGMPCNPNCTIKDAKTDEVKVEAPIVEVKEEVKAEVKEVAPIVAVEVKAKEEVIVEVPVVKEEVIEIKPHIKRYIEVIQTPEEQQEYIQKCVEARIKGRTRIRIV